MTNDKAQSNDSSKKFLETALERIAGAWKSFDLIINGPVYRDEIKAMRLEFGEQRVARGITAAIRQHLEFVPSIAQLWNYVRSAGEGGKRVHPDHCDKCGGSTWVTVEWKDEARKKTLKVGRCPDWKILTC
jgi:hypothetical protein